MTKTVFRNEGIVIEELPQTDGALVKADSEVLIQTPSEMSCGEPFEENEATDIAMGEYESNFDQLWLSTIGSSVATGSNVLQAIKNDGTLYRLVNDAKLSSAGNGLKSAVERLPDGSIKKHGVFAEVGGTAARVASQVLAQGMLIQISLQLGEINAKVQEILDNDFREACKKLKGTTEGIGRGIRHFKDTGSRDLLVNPLSANFDRDFDVLHDKVKVRMCNVQTKPKLYENWHLWGKGFEGKIERDCELIRYALFVLFNAIGAAAKGFSIYNSRLGIDEAMKRLKEMRELDYSRLLDAIRILPYNDKWKDFENAVLATGGKLPDLIDSFGKQPVFVLTGRDIHLIAENT